MASTTTEGFHKPVNKINHLLDATYDSIDSDRSRDKSKKTLDTYASNVPLFKSSFPEIID